MRLRFTVFGREVWALELERDGYEEYPILTPHEGEHIIFSPDA